MSKIFKNKSFLVSCLLILLVGISQYILLPSVLERGYPRDDWGNWLTFKFISGSIINKIVQNWLMAGPQFQSFGLYLGVLEAVLGDKHYLFNFISVILKALASVSIFAGVYVIFRNRFLAFLAALFFAVSHSSAGALAIMVNGGEYLGIILINLSLIFYYYSVKKFRIFKIFLAGLFLFLAYVLAANRVYPISLIIILAEAYLIFRRFSPFKYSLLRIFTAAAPLILIVLFSPRHINYGLGVKGDTLQLILNGNWQLLLTNTLSGIGFMIINSEFIKQANISLSAFTTFGSYISFLTEKLLWIFIFTAFTLSAFLSKKPVRFFLTVLVVYMIFVALNYFVSSHSLFLPPSLQFPPDQYFFTSQVALLVSYFALSLAAALLIEYFREKEKRAVLLLPFFSLMFSIIFLYSPWVIAGRYYSLWPVHRYLTTPQIGVSLFFASLALISYQRFSGRFKRYFILIIGFFLVLNFFQTRSEINRFFSEYIIAGSNITAERAMELRFLKKIPPEKLGSNIMIYISPSADSSQSQYWLAALDINNIPNWLSLRKSYLYAKEDLSGCIASTSDMAFLKEKAFNKNTNEFFMKGKCFEQNSRPILIDKDDVVFSLDDFYAFKVEGSEPVDIRDEILKDLQIY